MESSEISVIIPCLNEAGNIESTVATVLASGRSCGVDLEIILVNDGSTDGTGELCDRLANQYENVRVIHHPSPLGMGASFLDGLAVVSKSWVAMVPGNNLIEGESIKRMLESRESAEMILMYFENSSIRPLGRRIFSSTYVLLMNLLFGLTVKYYNGPNLFRTDQARSVAIPSKGHAYMSAIVVQLLRQGRAFREVGMKIKPRAYGRSKLINLRNLFSIFGTFIRLIRLVYFPRKDPLKAAVDRESLGIKDKAPS